MPEFTGERVIPGEVDVDLLNEHLARYAFASRLARGKRVLDAGCGAGYGSAELAGAAATVTGVDVSAQAIAFARGNYSLPNLTFEQGSCLALPHADASFELVVAFEVIEHLEDWRGFLREVARVLTPAGQFIVSTPNKLYYTESRGLEGLNPFHVHEFEFAEFRDELQQVFPSVLLFLENHVEGVTFQPCENADTAEVRVDTGEPAPGDSHFFVAVCAGKPQTGAPTFVYVPRAANVLRERERHIGLLERELLTKNGWLEKAQQDLAEFDREHQKLLAMFRDQTAELESRNAWAQSLDREIAERRARVAELQEEASQQQQAARQMADSYEAKVVELEENVRARSQWALDTVEELTSCREALNRTEKEFEDRTAWALRLQEEVRQLESQVALVRASRWVKLGRKVGIGPALPTS